jgi:hypothetical protein
MISHDDSSGDDDESEDEVDMEQISGYTIECKTLSQRPDKYQLFANMELPPVTWHTKLFKLFKSIRIFRILALYKDQNAEFYTITE